MKEEENIKLYKKKNLTYDEAVRLEYELLLLNIALESEAALLYQLNLTRFDVLPFTERLNAVQSYLKTTDNPLYCTNQLTNNAKLYALQKATTGEFEKDKEELLQEAKEAIFARTC